jgi:hypothetical protein
LHSTASPQAEQARRVIGETEEGIQRGGLPFSVTSEPYRYRVKVSVSTKGVRTHEHTCEGDDLDRVLAESDRLFEELEQRYPNDQSKLP